MILECLKSVLYGIVEGVTEWLPISSTGHLILLNSLLPLDVSAEFYEFFEVVIQLGAILAVVVSFFNAMNPFGTENPKKRKKIWQNWVKVIIGCIPAGVCGILLNDWFDEHFYNATVVSITLILYGVLFILMENWNRTRDFKIRKLSQLSYAGAFAIGCIQVLALVPGTSRSGATILGAMLLGVARPVAAEFSFYLSVPVMAGASLLKLIHFGFSFTGTEIAVMVIGMAVAFGVSMIAIRLLMDYVKTHDFKAFGYYRIVIGILFLLYFTVTGGTI